MAFLAHFEKKNTPVNMGNINTIHALDRYDTEGVTFLEFYYDVSFERSIFSKIHRNN